jgi:hypothetical protein
LRAATLVLVLALITAFGGRFEPMENDLRDRGSRPDPQQAPSVHGYFQGEPAAPPWSKAAARVEPLIQRYAIVPTMGSRSTASSTGTVAVVEVFRAFTTAAVALANGAAGIVMVRTIEEALALPDAEIGQILWVKFEVEHRMALVSATHRSRSRRSISAARQSSSGRVPVHRAL